MSSFNAILNISNVVKDGRLTSVTFGLQRTTDNIGRPVSSWRPGTIAMKLEATDSSKLMEWCSKSTDQKDGEITFQKIDGEQSMIKLQWKYGYIISHHIQYGPHGLTIDFTISAKDVTYGNGTIKQPWPAGGGA
jgi:hypothetical protein